MLSVTVRDSTGQLLTTAGPPAPVRTASRAHPPAPIPTRRPSPSPRHPSPGRCGPGLAGRPVAGAPVHLVTRLGGYGAELSPATLSAGERQLIALVRAHLSPARLAMLDEATCHLDPAAAARAEGAFADRPGALIVIAYRISSALRAQRVLVLDGTRAAVGDHASLLASSPLYRDLVGQWGTDHDPAAEPGPGGELASRV